MPFRLYLVAPGPPTLASGSTTTRLDRVPSVDCGFARVIGMFKAAQEVVVKNERRNAIANNMLSF